MAEDGEDDAGSGTLCGRHQHPAGGIPALHQVSHCIESFVIGFFLLKMPLVDLVQCSVDAELQFIFSGRQEPPSSDTELSADRS